MTSSAAATAYLGPDHGRWRPQCWQDIKDAAKGGLLDESHWVDLKLELVPGKAKLNTDIAKDLASLAVDGGLLVIGIEDHDSHAGEVVGVELARLADRVDQIARDKVRPSLAIRSVEMEDPDRPGWGCLLVHVPPSPLAPHMVDYSYYGRTDRANARLADEQVRLIRDNRARHDRDIERALQDLVDHDPMPTDQRELGHLYVLAQPVSSTNEAMVPLLESRSFTQTVTEMARQCWCEDLGNPQVAPALYQVGTRRQRAGGVALTTGVDPASFYEPGFLELTIWEDGAVSLVCGRGVENYRAENRMPRPEPERVVFPGLILSLVHSVLVLAGGLSDQHSGYQGEWLLGVRIVDMSQAVAYDIIQSMWGVRDRYDRAEYQGITTASTEDLTTAPEAIVQRLVAPLLRGLGVGRSYLPYTVEILKRP